MMATARVVAHYREKYRVRAADNEYWAEVTGKMIFAAAGQADFPVVGDLVTISVLENDHAVIEKILPRKTLLQRKAAGRSECQPIAANLDTAFIVQAVDRDFNLNRLERYLTIVCAAKVRTVAVLNKADLLSEAELSEKRAAIAARFPDLPVLTTSAAAGTGLPELNEAMEAGKVYCFVGSSGAGKSSLINSLLGKELLKTKELSLVTGKGKHTTTHRELFFLPGGSMVIDNPGMREVGVTEVSGDLAELAKECKYADCTHEHEPGCAVLDALRSGKIGEEQYQNYLKLKKEADHYALTSLEKRNKDRAFGQMLKAYKKMKR